MSKAKDTLKAIGDWFKGAFKSIGQWLKGNWLTALVIALVIVVAIFLWRGCNQNESYQNLFEKYREQTKEHQEQIDELKKVQEKEAEEREKLRQEYLNKINELRKDYNDKLDDISSNTNNKRKRIIREHEEDPESLTKRIEETFGIPVEE